MRYQWGPLLRDGGERRLNVAATRAKHRLTLVSSFASHDVDPDRVTKAGARLLADYLEYAGSGGTAMGATGAAELNPFEADVRDRLAACGITVVPQYGVGGYRVDFAAAHPEDAGRMVLAIEADGASYRESGSVRDRDRLRGEHLQRLGWRFHRLWSTNWFQDPQAEMAKVRDAYERAVSAADPPPADPPPAEPKAADRPAADPSPTEPHAANLPATTPPTGAEPGAVEQPAAADTDNTSDTAAADTNTAMPTDDSPGDAAAPAEPPALGPAAGPRAIEPPPPSGHEVVLAARSGEAGWRPALQKWR